MKDRTFAAMLAVFAIGVFAMGALVGAYVVSDDGSSEIEIETFNGQGVTCYVLGEELSCLKN